MYELEKIFPAEGRVQLRDHKTELVVELRLSDGGQPVDPKASLQFHAAPLRALTELYQDLSGRTVLLPDGFTMKLDHLSHARSRREATAELEQLFATNGLIVEDRGKLVTLIVPENQREVLKEISVPPAVAADESLPPGLIKFVSADVLNVLAVYQVLTGRMVLRPSRLRAEKISVKMQTALSREQAIWTLDSALRLAGLVMLRESDKFVFAVPPEQTNNLPHFDRAAIATRWGVKEGEPGVIKFVDADANQVLGTFAALVARTRVPLAPDLPPVRFSLQNQQPLDRVETIYALEAVAWLNNVAFEKVDPMGVQLVPAVR